MTFGTSLMADVRSLWSDMSIDDMHKLTAIFASIADEFDTCDCLGFEINHTAAMDQILCAIRLDLQEKRNDEALYRPQQKMTNTHPSEL